MAEWSRVINTTLNNYLRKEEVNMMRKRRLTALLQANGCITYNWDGNQTEQRVRYRRVPMSGYADMDIATFARQDRWKRANLDWRGYNITDQVSKKEKLMNKGEPAIIKLFSQIGEMLKKDMEDQFAEEYYIDGNAAGNEKKMHGLESFFGQGGSVSVANGYKSPDDSFAGLDTDLAAYGGSWTGTWPGGSGDPQYDFWSPIIINYTHASAWSDGSTWATNCQQVLRIAIIKGQRSGTKEGQFDVIMVDDTMYAALLTKLASLEHIVFKAGDKSSLTALGFKDVLNFDGTDVTWEFGVPANTGYGINTNHVETRSLQPQLFVMDGPDWDPVTKTFRFAVDFWGNTFWNPRFQTKLYPYG